MNDNARKRIAFLVMGVTDMLLGSVTLLAYFRLLPFDLDGLGIPSWVLGVVGAVLFLMGFAVFRSALSAVNPRE